MAIELYVFPGSPRAFKIMAVANHLGLDCEIRLVDMAKGGHRVKEFETLNPNRRMPALKHGDFVLWESEAIQQYLALQRPDSGLLPSDELSRLDVTRWQFWNLAHWDSSCAVFIFEHVVKPRLLGITQPDQAAIEKAQEPFRRSALVLDAQLKGRSWITGERLTLADFSLGAALNLSGPAQLPVEPYSEIRRWFAGLNSLPAWQKTLAQQKALSS